MKTGVNVNGIRWIKEGKTFNCFYQLSSDVELHKTFDNVTDMRKYVDELNVPMMPFKAEKNVKYYENKCLTTVID